MSLAVLSATPALQMAPAPVMRVKAPVMQLREQMAPAGVAPMGAAAGVGARPRVREEG